MEPGEASAARSRRGAVAWASGHAAEESVARRYEMAGCAILERRWRGASGEIDLIVREGETIVFVEVKQSSSFASAAERLCRRQMDRICLAACEFCGTDCDMRFDAALVDAQGRVELVQNAFGWH
ncbi:hypothetical protein GI374_03800 [Paracoccus sp. S-4012]|uniref:YraN family protein n=1 Tax=Paracoccus sp. S-4012 TaxID=2665648 RepID=UPI0012AF562C|nr:YraN family protein [Paracoccus sp. S-4012]MRX49581.1 hypothetical protein [Paracoccus sp. S-4012]